MRFSIHSVQVKPLHNIRVRPLCHVGVVLQRGIHGLLQFFGGRAFQVGKNAVEGIAVCLSNGIELERFDPDLKVGDLSVVAIGQRLDLTIELVLVDCAGIELEPEVGKADFQCIIVLAGHAADRVLQLLLHTGERLSVQSRAAVLDLDGIELGVFLCRADLAGDVLNLLLQTEDFAVAVELQNPAVQLDVRVDGRGELIAQVIELVSEGCVGAVQHGSVGIVSHDELQGEIRLIVLILEVVCGAGHHRRHAGAVLLDVGLGYGHAEAHLPVFFVKIADRCFQRSQRALGFLSLSGIAVELTFHSVKNDGGGSFLDFLKGEVQVAKMLDNIVGHCILQHTTELLCAYVSIVHGIGESLSFEVHVLNGIPGEVIDLLHLLGDEGGRFRALLVFLLDALALGETCDTAKASSDEAANSRSNAGNDGADHRSCGSTTSNAGELCRSCGGVGFLVLLIVGPLGFVQVDDAADGRCATSGSTGNSTKAERTKRTGSKGCSGREVSCAEANGCVRAKTHQASAGVCRAEDGSCQRCAAEGFLCAEHALANLQNITADAHNRHGGLCDDGSRHDRAEVCALAARKQLSCAGHQIAETREQVLLDGIKIEAISKAGSERLTDARSLVYRIRNVDAEEHHQPCAKAGTDARADVGRNVRKDGFAGRSPPLLEGVGNDLIPCDADLAAEVCILPFLGSGHVLHLGLKTVILAVYEIHKIVQGRFNLRHGCRQTVCNGANIRIQPLAEADLHAIHRALQQGDGARQVVELGVGHALGRASSIVDGVGQLVVVGLGGVQNGQQALLRTSASNGIGHTGFLLIVHVGGGIAQLLDYIGQSAGVALAVKELDAEALQGVEGVAGVRGQAGHNHVQRRTGHRCLDAAVRHQAGHQGHILNGVAERTSHRRSVLEGFAHHRHVRVGVR